MVRNDNNSDTRARLIRTFNRAVDTFGPGARNVGIQSLRPVMVALARRMEAFAVNENGRLRFIGINDPESVTSVQSARALLSTLRKRIAEIPGIKPAALSSVQGSTRKPGKTSRKSNPPGEPSESNPQTPTKAARKRRAHWEKTTAEGAVTDSGEIAAV